MVTLNIVVLNNSEEFIQHLDPELCEIVETIEKDGLRTLDFTYYFQDLVEDKKLFRIGNKLWISGDSNLTPCLYVINTKVVQDLYQENTFKCEMEEVLVELNYAPLFSQNELTKANGFTFSTNNNNEEYSVLVDWNSLNYWFGEYFNIGVVQKCISDYQAKIGLSGTVNLMSLLRYIEEETGNIFVTRYEKDCLNNTIHRYLDFLNPINVSKPWVLNLEYDFIEVDNTNYIYDSDDNLITDTYEDVYDEDDLVEFDDKTPLTNINPANVRFQITNELDQVLNTDGYVYASGDLAPALMWASSSVSFENNNQSAIISLRREKDYVGLTINEKEYATLEDSINGDVDKSYTTTDNPVLVDNRRDDCVIPDDSFFEIYDTVTGKVLFKTCINREIGHVHEEVLDFGYNLDNIALELDETDTYTAISPVLVQEDDDDKLTRANMSDLITRWQNLSINKGDVVPMIVEKITVTASSLANAKTSLGTYNVSTNYWSRPYKPNDSIDTNTPANSTWEFWKATAYWKAPYNKKAGELHIETDTVLETEYTHIQGRPDTRDDRDIIVSRPKMGTVETTAEDIYTIYNLVANKLREKQSPDFNLTVDVANLRDGVYNDYSLHDKVYVKIPDMAELLTARVVKTVKEGHDVAKNTIELANYSINTSNIQYNTFIEADNVSFKYPNTKNYTCRLVNMDYDATNSDSVEYLENKLLSVQVYTVDDGTSTLTKKSFTKVTDKDGKISLPLKFDPGDYELHITFGGDEEYLESTMTVEVNVSGTKTVKKTSTKKTTKKATKSKTVKKKKTTTTKKKTNKAKKVTSKKTRTIIGNPSKYIRKLALNIVGDSTGLAAAKKIVRWVDNNVKYELYANFHRSPDTVAKKKRANCCDQARLVLTLCDAAGCTDALTLKYVHVSKGSIGHVFCKIVTKKNGNWRYVDTCKWGNKAWGHYVHGYGSPPGTQTNYPNRPF